MICGAQPRLLAREAHSCAAAIPLSGHISRPTCLAWLALLRNARPTYAIRLPNFHVHEVGPGGAIPILTPETLVTPQEPRVEGTQMFASANRGSLGR